MEFLEFKCKCCGGSLVIVESSEQMGKCMFCSVVQAVPKPNNERIAMLYGRAEHLRKNHEYDKAIDIYGRILEEDSTDPEAYWSLLLCKYGVEYVKDPTSGEYILTVNRAQNVAVVADEDFRAAMQYANDDQRSFYETEARKIDEIQKGILEISSKEDPFDIFICYKETDANGDRTLDSVLAQDLYDRLTGEGYKVFFSRITLEDKLGSAYEPYIFAALHSAKVMLVVGTDPAHFDAVWVKNEWSRFLMLMGRGEKKTLIPAYRGMDPYDMPEEFAHLQALDMSKLGFEQDLVRGIKKIIGEKAIQKKEDDKLPTLIKRVFILLEDGDFDRADDFCEQILAIDPEQACAYAAKLCVELKLAGLEAISRDRRQGIGAAIKSSNNYKRVLKYGDADLINRINGYIEENEKNASSIPTSPIASASAANTISVTDQPSAQPAAQPQFGAPILPNLGIYSAFATPSAGQISLSDYTVCEKKEDVEDMMKLVNVLIPNGVKAVGKNAFKGCLNLQRVILSDSVESIEEFAFEGCNKLATVELSNGVSSIDPNAFARCRPNRIEVSDGNKHFKITEGGLYNKSGGRLVKYFGSDASVCIPQGVSVIGSSAFAGRDDIVEVVLPQGVADIEDGAFEGCRRLKRIGLPDGLISIGFVAFSDCSSLRDITIPSSVINFNSYALRGCDELEKIIVDSSNANYSATDGVLYNKDKSVLLRYPCGKVQTSFNIPSGVTVIGENAFADAMRLKSVNICEGIVKIGADAFADCVRLESVTLPKSLRRIETCAFVNCQNVKRLTLKTPNKWKAVSKSGEAKSPFGVFASPDEIAKAIVHIDCNCDWQLN